MNATGIGKPFKKLIVVVSSGFRKITKPKASGTLLSEIEKEYESDITKNFGKSTMFPDLATLISTIQKEYEYESDRAKDIENRTGIFLAFIVALVVFLLTNFQFSNVIFKRISFFEKSISYSLLIISIAITCVTLIACIFCFIKVISIEKYKRLNINDFTEEYAKGKREAVEMRMILEYKDILLYNTKVNDKKSNYYKGGLYVILVSLLFAISTYVISILL